MRGGLNKIIYFRSNYNGDGSYGNITYTIPAGYENATFTLKITTSDTNDSKGNLTVATPQTSAVNHYFNIGETYAWVVTASAGEKITITTPDDNSPLPMTTTRLTLPSWRYIMVTRPTVLPSWLPRRVMPTIA